MSTAFDGPRRKLERARLHIESFCFHERQFFGGGAYRIVDERQPNSNHHLFKLAVEESFPREAFAVIVGDAIHNLRSALDHLAWQLAEDHSGANAGDTATQFPAFKTEAGFDGRGVTRHTARIGPNARERMRALQPFKVAPGREEVHTLWLISDLDNRDKHKNLAIAAATMRGYEGQLIHSPRDRGKYTLTINQEDLADGDIVGELLIEPPDAKIEVEASFDFGVVLTSPSVPDTKPRIFVNRFLHRCASWVEGVLNAFEPFYATGAYDDRAPLPSLSSYHWAPPPPDTASPWWETRLEHDHAAFAEDMRDRIKARLGDSADDPEAISNAVAGFQIGLEAGYARGAEEGLRILKRLSFELPDS